jgi:hypothetical protein
MCHYLTVSDSDALRDTNLCKYTNCYTTRWRPLTSMPAAERSRKNIYLRRLTFFIELGRCQPRSRSLSLYRERAHTFALRLAPISPLITRAGNQLLSLLKVVSRHTENERSSIHPWVYSCFFFTPTKHNKLCTKHTIFTIPRALGNDSTHLNDTKCSECDGFARIHSTRRLLLHCSLYACVNYFKRE